MRFEEQIVALGSKIGVPLQVDDEGACVLSVDDMAVTLQSIPEAESVGFWGEIGEPPPQDLEKLLSAMLEANHMFKGTGGATISRDSETGSFFLCRILDLRNLDAEAFAAALERFVNVLEAWIRLVKDYRETAPEVPASDAPAVPPGLRDGGFLAV